MPESPLAVHVPRWLSRRWSAAGGFNGRCLSLTVCLNAYEYDRHGYHDDQRLAINNLNAIRSSVPHYQHPGVAIGRRYSRDVHPLRGHKRPTINIHHCQWHSTCGDKTTQTISTRAARRSQMRQDCWRHRRLQPRPASVSDHCITDRQTEDSPPSLPSSDRPSAWAAEAFCERYILCERLHEVAPRVCMPFLGRCMLRVAAASNVRAPAYQVLLRSRASTVHLSR
jgi:hypothetical protein